MEYGTFQELKVILQIVDLRDKCQIMYGVAYLISFKVNIDKSYSVSPQSKQNVATGNLEGPKTFMADI